MLYHRRPASAKNRSQNQRRGLSIAKITARCGQIRQARSPILLQDHRTTLLEKPSVILLQNECVLRPPDCMQPLTIYHSLIFLVSSHKPRREPGFTTRTICPLAATSIASSRLLRLLRRAALGKTPLRPILEPVRDPRMRLMLYRWRTRHRLKPTPWRGRLMGCPFDGLSLGWGRCRRADEQWRDLELSNGPRALLRKRAHRKTPRLRWNSVYSSSTRRLRMAVG